MGLLDRHGDRRRARDLRRHLPALEHRPRRRRDPAPAAHRRLPAGDGAHHHRPRDRRRRGAPIGLVNEVVPSRTCVDRASSSPTTSPRSPSRRSAPTTRPSCAASEGRSTRACASRPSASTACSRPRRSSRACAGSTSATTPTGIGGGPADARHQPGVASRRARAKRARKCPMVISNRRPCGSPLARGVAAELDLAYLDWGAMYRCCALAGILRGTDLDDPEATGGLAPLLQMGLDGDRVELDGRGVSRTKSEQAISEASSRVSVRPGVREAMVAGQRRDDGHKGVRRPRGPRHRRSGQPGLPL